MRKIIFGITGGSGAGKTLVSGKFKKEGVFVVDADVIAHNITKKGSKCLLELCKAFGKEILFPDGSLNRKKLGQIAFSDEKKLKLLNRITHKYINKEALHRIKQAKQQICAIDGAVIIGSPLEKSCAYMVCVMTEKDIRCKRIMKRDKISFKDAMLRINAQPKDIFYINNADFIIRNDGKIGDVNNQVKKITEILKREAYE